MNNRKRRLAAAGLCLALSMGMLTGCSGNAGKAIATLEGEKTEFAVANIMLRYNQAQMQSFYGAYMGDNMWSQYGETTRTDIMSGLKQMLILEKHMDEYDVSLTDEQKTAIQDAAAQFMKDNEASVIKALDATQERVERVLTLYTIQTEMRKAIIKDVDRDVSDDEAAQKTVRYAFFSTADTTDEDGNSVALTDDEKSALLDQAEQLRDAVAGGQDMDEALKEIDENKSTSESSYGDNDESYSLDESVRTAADGLEDGQVADDVVTTDSGYYVVQMVANFDEAATEQKKQSIITERENDKFDEVYEGWETDADYTEDQELIESMTFTDTYELYVEETETETETAGETESDAQVETSAETESGAETTAQTESEAETSAE